MIFDIVIFHGNCPDGECAAWVYKKYIKDNNIVTTPTYIGMRAGTFVEMDYTDKKILLMDISFNQQNLLNVSKVATQITILDHHKSARDNLTELRDNVTFVFDMERCGAQLAWDYFFGGIPYPWFLNFIADRDLWKLKIAEAKPASIYFQYHDMYNENGFNKLYSMKTEDISQLISEGSMFEYAYNNEVDTIAKNSISATFNTKAKTYKVELVECIAIYASDVGNKLAKIKECDFSVMFRYNFELNQWIFSCRAVKDDIDLSKITTEFGGGGHPKAAGFTLNGVESIRKVFKNVN